MYTLFINDIEIGKFRSVKSLMISGCDGQEVRGIKWIGNTCYITTRQNNRFGV